jgi:hypothetical protein
MALAISLDTLLGIAGLIAAIPVSYGWTQRALLWNTQRKIRKLQSDREMYLRLAGSDREYFGWLLHSLLLVVTVFTMALMFQSVHVAEGGASFVAAIHWILGGLAYFLAVNTLGIYARVKRCAATIEAIDARLARFQGKS